MPLTPQRKALVGLLGVGLLVLIGDRLLSGPAPVEAKRLGSDTPTKSAEAQPGARVSEPAPRGIQTGTPLLHQMQALPEATDLARASRLDAFKPPAAWVPEIPEEAPPPVPEPQNTRADAFKNAYKLTAVLTGPGGDCAVIGGRTITLGQILDGFTLTAISPRSVTFRSRDVEVELHLPDPADGGSWTPRR